MAGQSLACPACGHAIVIPRIEHKQSPGPAAETAGPTSPSVPAGRRRSPGTEVFRSVHKSGQRPLKKTGIELKQHPKPAAETTAPGSASVPAVRRRPPGKRVRRGIAKSEQRALKGSEEATARREKKHGIGRAVTLAIAVALVAVGSLWITARGRGPVPGKNARVAGLSLHLVWVGDGSFQMGSHDGDNDEQPVRTVRITRGYWIGKMEVTNRQYQRFIRKAKYNGQPDADGDYMINFNGGSKMPTKNRHPAVWVSWQNAVAFCKWLTERERRAGRLPAGYVYRLPTEAEWESAARGGKATLGYTHSGGRDVNASVWHKGNSGGATHPVGTKAANELGIHDMNGNVWEWCHDWYQGNYSGLEVTDPAGPEIGDFRVLRGCGWNDEVRHCRTTYRGRLRPPVTTSFVGFRVALAPRGSETPPALRRW